jgi:hypothetical protein
MMLSPQAARMGTVYTTLRNIGCSRRHILNGVGGSRFATLESHLPCGNAIDETFAKIMKYNRAKSTLAHDESDDESNQLPEPATLKTKSMIKNVAIKKGENATQLDYAAPAYNDVMNPINATWTANLGRDKNIDHIKNEWFTGISPDNSLCPGMLK